jgi:hypothetical protein
MDKSGWIGLTIAIGFFGIICSLFGYLYAKANPLSPEFEKNDSEMTFSNEEARKRYRLDRRKAIQAIHFRRDGIFVFLLSLTTLIVLLFVPNFVFPNADVLERMDDFIHTKIKTPWGNIYIIGLSLELFSIYFFALGRQAWRFRKLRHDYFPALFFWGSSIYLFLWGIFQWGSH